MDLQAVVLLQALRRDLQDTLARVDDYLYAVDVAAVEDEDGVARLGLDEARDDIAADLQHLEDIIATLNIGSHEPVAVADGQLALFEEVEDERD